LVKINEIAVTDALPNIVSDENLVRASNDRFTLIEQFKPLHSVVKIPAADKVREVFQLAPTHLVDDLIEFPMIRGKRQVKSVPLPLDLREQKQPNVFNLDYAPSIPPTQSSGY